MSDWQKVLHESVDTLEKLADRFGRDAIDVAALGPAFSKLPRPKAYGSVFFMADENWALTMGEFAKGRRDGAFLIGGGVLMLLAWSVSTLIGGVFGSAVEDPARSSAA